MAPRSVLFAVTLLALLALRPPAAAADAPAECAVSPLVITEVGLSDAVADGARWVELHNPTTNPIALDKIQLTISLPVLPGMPAGPPMATYPLGTKASAIAAGGWLALGWKGGAPTAPPNLVELGYAFTLPCKALLTVSGPAGPIDEVAWDLCGAKSAAWSLDAGQLSACSNDTWATWCPTSSPGAANGVCDLDGDGFAAVAVAGAAVDCNDLAKSVFPGAAELCNGIDEDCDGQTDEGVAPPPGLCLTQGVCGQPLPPGKSVASCDGKGGFVCNYPWGYESLQETLCDGHDNDCDGLTDEGLTNACGQCGALATEVCNGIDDDCNGATDEAVPLSLSCPDKGVCAQAKPACQGGAPVCAMPLSFEVTESRCDGLDNDCDGSIDEEMGLGGDCHKGVGSCTRAGTWQCSTDGGLLCNAVPGAPQAELCGDGLDNDCDAATDEDFDVGTQCTAGTGACRVVGKRMCSPTRLQTTCSVAPLAPSEERCGNDVDDDCDGQTDEAGCSDGRDHGCTMGRGGSTSAAAPLGLGALLLALVVQRRRVRCCR